MTDKFPSMSQFQEVAQECWLSSPDESFKIFFLSDTSVSHVTLMPHCIIYLFIYSDTSEDCKSL